MLSIRLGRGTLTSIKYCAIRVPIQALHTQNHALDAKVEGKRNDNIQWFWPRPKYDDPSLLEKIAPSHREPRNRSDRIALTAVKIMRSSFDKATGYLHDDNATMTSKQWLRRIIFLESVAGVPGIVAGMLRHLRSIRKFEQDRGWIETLLEEAMNERMHLLTFMAIRQPGIMMRSMIILAQGVFTNMLFFSYLFSPRTCHRFVGYLEEEAVYTYTKCLTHLDAGKLPEWSTQRVPPIAQKYWGLGEDATMRDLILAVRNDEAKHREVNHTFANCESDDPCAFSHRLTGDDGRVIIEPKGMNPAGWEREEVLRRQAQV